MFLHTLEKIIPGEGISQLYSAELENGLVIAQHLVIGETALLPHPIGTGAADAVCPCHQGDGGIRSQCGLNLCHIFHKFLAVSLATEEVEAEPVVGADVIA